MERGHSVLTVTELPLNQRVTAPATVERPASDGELTWRAATTDDIDGIHEAAKAMAAVDHPHYVETREEIAEEFDHSYVDPSTDSTVAVTPDGTLVAWGFATMPPGQDTLVRSILFGGVRPDHRGRGIGRRLFAWQRERGLQQLASSPKTLPGWLVTYLSDGVTDAQHLYERSGLVVTRYFLELTRDVSLPIAPHPLDPEFRLENFSAARSELTRLSRNDAFRDHWGSQPTTEEQWESFVGRSTTRPDLSHLAIVTNPDGAEEVAGFVLTSVSEDDWPGQGFSSGYIDLVGVARQWRRRGIAPALLTSVMHAIADAGLERAVLDVDSDNPSGALGLYEGVGFGPSHRSMCFVQEF